MGSLKVLLFCQQIDKQFIQNHGFKVDFNDTIELENPTSTRITSKERVDTRIWDMVALREAIINAFVYYDFTGEVPPKFEIFPDRIEFISAGGLPDGLSQEEFFRGFSVPRNKELMRIFKDLGMVEQLGSSVPRILQSYGRECFAFSDNFLRMVFPIRGGQAGGQAEQSKGKQQEILELIKSNPSISRMQLSEKLKWGGQKIIALPELNMVIVFTVANYTSGVHEFEIFEKYILPAVSD